MLVFALAFALVGGLIIWKSFAAPPPSYRTTSFATDPGWVGINNRPDPSIACANRQFNFGWKNTNNAGGANGEIGGRIDNSSTYQAYYAKKLSSVKTLADRLYASGSMVLPNFNNTAVLFGWFNAQNSIDWRAAQFFGLRLSDGVGTSNRVYGDFATTNNFATDDFFVPSTGSDYLLISPGQRFTWTAEYDPSAGTYGTTTISVTVSGVTYSATLPLSDIQRADGATFDHFGFLNIQLGTLNYKNAFVDNLQLNSGPSGATESFDFSTDPGWEGYNNKLSSTDCKVLGRNDFGWSNSNAAGGSAGEIGGTLWVSGKKASYGDRVGPLSLDDRLYVSGRIVLNSANTDSDIPWIGWYNSTTDTMDENGGKNFIGARVGGSAGSGYRLSPTDWNKDGVGGIYNTFRLAPMLTPKKEAKNFWICYEPNADSDGNGRLTVGVNTSQTKYKVTAAQKAAGASFDRFGFLNTVADSRSTTLFVDDLRYTVSPGDSAPGCGQATPGDINGDGKVDILDLSRMLTYWATTSSSPNYDPASDLNHDNSVDVVDLSILLSYWTQ